MIVTIHHSDSDDPRHDNIDTIRQWHVVERNFKDVGYHFFIKSDGSLEFGRNYWERGAHVKGMNVDNIGICLHGKKVFSNRQLATLKNLLLMLHHAGILESFDHVYGHCELNDETICPQFDVKKFIKEEIPGFYKS